MNVLVVTTEFADYAKGHVIKDAEEIEKVLETHSGHVVRAIHPDEHDDQ